MKRSNLGMDFETLLLRRRGLVFAVPAGALAVLVIVAAINFDSGTSGRKKTSRIEGAQELLAPRTATAEELARASGSITDQTSVSLASGAWIQVADETGRLAQQYSATKLEPLQGSQLAMTEPRSMVYMKDGRVLVLSARKGVAYVPRRALESGTLEEDVEVRLFRPEPGRAVDIDRDVPAVVVIAEQAQFDGVLGEVRCAKEVRVSTDAGSFAGEGLTLQLDADGDGLEQLIVDRATEPIRIDRAARAMAAKRREARAEQSGVLGTSTGLADVGERPNATTNGATDASGDAPSAGENANAPTSGGAQKKDRPPFYRLTMLGGVEVVRLKDGVRSTITGEEIVAVFSLESRGLDDLAFVPRTSSNEFAMNDMVTSKFAGQQTGASMRTSLSSIARVPLYAGIASTAAVSSQAALAIAPHAYASLQASSESDSVTVSFGGRLVMVPATDPADQLTSQDEIRFDVVGPRVEVLDGKSGSRIVCTRLRYAVQEEFVEATGTSENPLRVSNPRMQLEGTRFFASLSKGEGRIDGGGRMSLGRGLAQRVSLLGETPAIALDASRMLVSADPAAIALVARTQSSAPGTPPAKQEAEPFRFDPSSQEIEITWKDGVDLRFNGEGDNAKLSLARFGGGVNVFGRQFELDSQTLEVAFSPNDAERIDAIIADGGTRVRRLGGEGAMAAGRIELFLGEDSKGDTIPRRLVARQAVEARDERQTVWTEDLVVGFREKPKGAGAASGHAQGSAPPARGGSNALLGGDESLGAIDIDTVEAKGGVQVLLKEGARVFAETLVGDAARRRLRLTGENVAIVRSNVIADNLRDLRFDDATRSARSDGPGRFRAFRAPIALAEGKIARPEPEGRPTLDASWGESLEYAEVAENRGTLDIRGEVKVRSRPSETTSDAVDAQSILLELGIDTAAKSEKAGAESKAADPAEAARSFDHFIAKGGARVESRQWENAERTGEPRVFRVSGEHVEYDMKTREGLVVGDGAILVNIPRAVDAKAIDPSSAAKDRAPGGIALGADGTTRFRWKERMALEKQYDDVFRILMEKDVELLHAGLRADDSLSMRCDVLEAIVKRPDESKKSSASGSGTEKSEGGVDLGGPAEMLGVKGRGRVFIRTPEQDVECGEFDYSVTTGVATLTAEEGRSVTIAIKGQPAPIRAQQVVWDLRNGRIQVTKMNATGGR